jgi:hypothetical protein
VLWLYEDRGRLAPAQCHRRFVDPHRDRVTAEQALMQDLHPGAFDKTQLDQPPLEFGGGEAMIGVFDPNRPNFSDHSDRRSAERHCLACLTLDLRTLALLGAGYCDSLSLASCRIVILIAPENEELDACGLVFLL